MPELPEVESARRTVSKFMLGSPITTVNLLEQGEGPRHGLFDEIICTQSQGEMQAFLHGRAITSCHRRGKQLYFAVSSMSKGACVVEGFLLMHFGMTGAFVVKDETVPQYKAVKIDQQNFPPRFCKLHLSFANGRQLAFSDPRRLGRIRLLVGRALDPLAHLPLSQLARDPLLEGLPTEYFLPRLLQSAMPIKALLLDQEKVVSGVGNYLADEILYQCRVHPRSVASAIPAHKAAELASATVRIIQAACDCTERNEDFPSDWMFHYRWGKGKSEASPVKETSKAKKNKESSSSSSSSDRRASSGIGAIEGIGLNRMPDGGMISFDTVGGRTSAVVETVQVKYTERGERVAKAQSPAKKAGKAGKTGKAGKADEADKVNGPTKAGKGTKAVGEANEAGMGVEGKSKGKRKLVQAPALAVDNLPAKKRRGTQA